MKFKQSKANTIYTLDTVTPEESESVPRLRTSNEAQIIIRLYKNKEAGYLSHVHEYIFSPLKGNDLAVDKFYDSDLNKVTGREYKTLAFIMGTVL